MKILYFTDDFGAKNQEFAKQHGLTIRNAKAFSDDDFLEQCDAVYGDVPKAYADKYPLHELPKEQGGQEPKSKAKTKEPLKVEN